MPDLILTEHGLRLTSKKPWFEIRREDCVIQQVPAGRVDAILLGPGVGISAAAIQGSRQLRIPLLWVAMDGRPLSWRQETDYDRAALRFAQAMAIASPLRLQFVQATVQAKLTTLGSERSCSEATTIAQLMGIEGDATRSYFQRYFSLWPEDWRPERRSKRPPKDEANSLLSFGYGLLSSWMLREILVAGLDPSWGFGHEVRRGMPGLVQDLIEPFRAAYVDPWALGLVAGGSVTQEMFHHVDRGVFIRNGEARRTCIRSFIEGLDCPSPHHIIMHSRTTRKAMGAMVREVAAAITQSRPPVFVIEARDVGENP